MLLTIDIFPSSKAKKQKEIRSPNLIEDNTILTKHNKKNELYLKQK